jgi:predicted nucleic acid-binding Zn ribbon protein
MTDPAVSEAARQLATRRPRGTYTCVVCGETFTAIAQRGPRTPNVCSQRCRDRRKNQRRKLRTADQHQREGD